MSCQDIQQEIDRYARLDQASREEIRNHLENCPDCRDYFSTASALADSLQPLAEMGMRNQSDILNRLKRHSGVLRGQGIWALSGAMVALVAAIILFLQGDTAFAGFALTGTLLVLLFVAWRSAREARLMFDAAGDRSAVALWRSQLKKERRQVVIEGPAICVGFLVLTVAVVIRHGVDDFRWLIFAGVWLFVAVYVARQFFVRRPAIDRELSLLDELTA